MRRVTVGRVGVLVAMTWTLAIASACQDSAVFYAGAGGRRGRERRRDCRAQGGDRDAEREGAVGVGGDGRRRLSLLESLVRGAGRQLAVGGRTTTTRPGTMHAG